MHKAQQYEHSGRKLNELHLKQIKYVYITVLPLISFVVILIITITFSLSYDDTILEIKEL